MSSLHSETVADHLDTPPPGGNPAPTGAGAPSQAPASGLSKDASGNDTPGGFPRGVGRMAFTELWERFSFYGLQSILSFYLLYALADGGLEVPALAAAGIVGAYGGAVYLAQIVGAWVGERLISPARMVLIGGIIITAGHLALAFIPGMSGLAVGLVLIVLGTGALKTNITSIVGFMLDGAPKDSRDAGFSYFYMAINVGAVAGPLLTGFVQNEWGFHLGFALAAVGMLGALVQYLCSMKSLPERARRVSNPLPRTALIKPLLAVVAFVLVLVIATSLKWLTRENLATVTTMVALIVAAWYFGLMLFSRKVARTEKVRVGAFLPLFLVAGLYFGFLFQKFTAISILIKERVNLQVGDWSFPVAWITMVSPLAAVLITPLIARLWNRLGARQPKAATKFAIGITQIGVAYLYLLLVTQLTGDAVLPLLLILLFMVMAGSSEVFIGPIGLSLATRIGPGAFKSQMVALNFLTLALGSSLSGQLGQLFTKIPEGAYFGLVSGTAILIGLVLFAVRKPLNRLLEVGLD